MATYAHRIGAVLYVVWGVLHLKACYATYELGHGMADGLEQARVFQDAFTLGWSALYAIVVGIWLNWRNSRIGFWSNFVVVSLVDIGFIVHVLAPGHVPLIPTILGPITWLLAVCFTAIGLHQIRPSKTM